MKKEYMRMCQWFLLSIAAYAIATWLSGINVSADSLNGLYPRVQSVLWKCGHLNLAAYLGYWFDRRAFRDRIWPGSPAMQHIRRAIIMGATIIGFAMAL